MGSTLTSSKAFSGQMYSSEIANSHLEDQKGQNIALLKNFLALESPGKFSKMQDSEIKKLAELMNPKNWETELLDGSEDDARDRIIRLINNCGAKIAALISTAENKTPATEELQTSLQKWDSPEIRAKYPNLESAFKAA